ncbi:MAG: dipeptidase [Acetobacteraceae bacterium]|nr:dipeptidase [Acetobacteraceae bacterium]
MMDAAALHRRLMTLDSHIDIPWPEGPDPFTDSTRCVDLPKMLRGGLIAGCFAAYVPQGPRDAQSSEAAFHRALAMLQSIHAMARGTETVPAELATTAAAIEAAHRSGKRAIIPVLENAHAIAGDLSRLAKLRELGVRYVTLTHNGHNLLADSAIPRAELSDPPSLHGGLSSLGRSAISEMNRLGILVDVSHSAKATMMQAAAWSKTPVIASHSCVRALCDHPRNLDDEQLEMLREADGVIQITAMPAFLRPQGTVETVSVRDFVDHIDYAVKRIGISHVGISSDFDGGGGITGWRNAAESENITAELLRRGYDEGAIALLWGGNFLRLLRAAEAAAA